MGLRSEGEGSGIFYLGGAYCGGESLGGDESREGGDDEGA